MSFLFQKKMKMFSVFMIFVTLMAALSPETEAKSLGGTKLYKLDRISGYHEEVLGLANDLFVGKWKEDQTKRQNLNDFLYYRGMLFPPRFIGK